ncbi:MAG: NAD(P)H-binding protein, partial [Devosia sp.]
TRDPSKLTEMANKGVDVRHGDFSDPASLDRAFKGIERLLVISIDKLDVPGGRKAWQTAAVEAAERAGVGHLIYTSITNPYPSPTALVADDHFWTEAAITRTGGDWTLLRNNLYMDLLPMSAGRAIASGQLFHACGDGRRALITRDDCAAVAAGALLTSTGKTVEDVSGPETLSQGDLAAAFAAASGKPVTAVNVPVGGMIDGMVGAGIPKMLAQAFAAFDTDTARGVFSLTGDAVRRLAGREATTLKAFLSANPLSQPA